MRPMPAMLTMKADIHSYNALHFVDVMISAAQFSLHMRQSSFYILRPLSTGVLQLFQQRGKLQQIVDAEPGTTPCSLHKHILRREARPRGEHRAQVPVDVKEHHPVLAPVEATGREHEPSSALRVERMGNLEGDRCLSVTMRCSC